VYAQALSQRLAIERPGGKRGEKIELDRTQQSPRRCSGHRSRPLAVSEQYVATFCG
jgi:hypothetical protein